MAISVSQNNSANCVVTYRIFIEIIFVHIVWYICDLLFIDTQNTTLWLINVSRIYYLTVELNKTPNCTSPYIIYVLVREVTVTVITITACTCIIIPTRVRGCSHGGLVDKITLSRIRVYRRRCVVFSTRLSEYYIDIYIYILFPGRAAVVIV